MPIELVGVAGDRVLFASHDQGFVLTTSTNSVSVHALDAIRASAVWEPTADTSLLDTWRELVESALAAPVTASSVQPRQYTVPKDVVTAARAAIVSGVDRTPAAEAVARTLVTKKQVPTTVVHSLAKYFAVHHDRDTSMTARDWWGGSAGEQWARRVFGGSTPITAAATLEPTTVEAFFTDDDTVEYVGEHVRDAVDMIAALYRTSMDDWSVFAMGEWVPCVAPDADLLTELDPETAVFVASSLYDYPDVAVSLRAIEPEEWALTDAAIQDLDFIFLPELVDDSVITAAGAIIADGEYTPEERAKNAEQQPRDSAGRFVKVGDSGALKSGQRISVIGVDPTTGLILVQDEGDPTKAYRVPSRELTIDTGFVFPELPEQTGQPQPPLSPLNLDGIIAQPRNVVGAKARLPYMLEPLDAPAIQQIILDYASFIEDERRRAATTAAAVTPETSDVEPLYIAIVDREDPQAVMELVSLVPASETSSQPTTFKRVGGKWVAAPEILADLKGATPPPVVNLDKETYQLVLDQVDASEPDIDSEATDPTAVETFTVLSAADVPEAGRIDGNFVYDADNNVLGVIAAGGADRNRGGAEHLRRYWTVGKGGLKIRWNTPGDGTRCIRYLRKYLGPRAAGYCQLRHMEMTGESMGRHNRD